MTLGKSLLSAAAQTVARLDATAQTIVVASRPRRRAEGLIVFTVVSGMVDKTG
jgi:hypothetical protein